MASLDKLLSNASSSLSEHDLEMLGQSRRLAGTLADQLLGMLCQRNGWRLQELSATRLLN